MGWSATSIPTSGEPLTTGDRTPGPRGKHQGTQTIRPPVTDGDPHPRENRGDPTPDPGILGSDKWALSGVRTMGATESGGGAHPRCSLSVPPGGGSVGDHTGTPVYRRVGIPVCRCVCTPAHRIGSPAWTLLRSL